MNNLLVLFREIQLCKWAEVLYCGSVVCARRVFFHFKQTQMNSLVGNHDLRMPLPLVEMLKISIINQCDLALRQWDQLGHYILRIKMPLESWDKHDAKGTTILAQKTPAYPKCFSLNYTSYAGGVPS